MAGRPYGPPRHGLQRQARARAQREISRVVNKAEQHADFFDRVYAIVDQIPVGRVTTYGHIARRLGAARSARMVGWALHTCAGTPLPAHRVVNRVGALSGALHFGGPHVMEDLLRSEGVTFLPDGRVDLSQHLWVPSEDPFSTE